VPIVLFTVPVFSTLLGGVLAISLRRFIFLLIAVGAGLLLGAAFLDLMPEALAIGARSGFATADVLGLTLLSFLLFHAIEAVLTHLGFGWSHSEGDKHISRRVGAGMLIFHSFRDGMAIGAAYSASHAAGYAVASGIAVHDLGDGMNTVLLTTGGDKPGRVGYGFLLADALAPLLGGALTFWWSVSARASVFLLVLAAGFFLQMATEDFLPEIRNSTGPKRYFLPCILLGATLIYGANRLLAFRPM
jgi:zinc and cadmium transporter